MNSHLEKTGFVLSARERALEEMREDKPPICGHALQERSNWRACEGVPSQMSHKANFWGEDWIMNLSAPQPTTVLFFDHTARLGGGEVSLFNLVTHIDRSQIEPVVVLGGRGELLDRLRGAGVEVHVLPLGEEVSEVRKDSLSSARAISPEQIIQLARYIWRLRGFMRARGAGIIHANSLKADLIAAIAARLAGVPVIWHVRDRIADDYLPPLATRAFRLLCRVLPTFIIVNSNATLATLQLPRERHARVIYNGVVHDGLPPEEFGESLAGQSLSGQSLSGQSLSGQSLSGQSLAGQSLAGQSLAGQSLAGQSLAGQSLAGRKGAFQETATATRLAVHPAAPLLIGLVGRISPWKGQDIFLRAAAQVVQKFPDAKFQIIGAPLFGEEPFESEVRALCTELGLDGRVEWMGFRRDVPQLVANLTLLVHASKTGEPFGQVVVEAMMAGKPVVATDGGGIPEIVLDGETGILVPMNDADSMARAIERVLGDPLAARIMGERGQKRASEHFSIHRTTNKITRVYEHLLFHQSLWARRKRAARSVLLGFLAGAAFVSWWLRRRAR